MLSDIFKSYSQEQVNVALIKIKICNPVRSIDNIALLYIIVTRSSGIHKITLHVPE